MILVASPLLRHPSFRSTILFICSHAKDDGAIAFVLNRPTGAALHVPSVGELAVYYGGPVMPESRVIASLQWQLPADALAFRTFEAVDNQSEEIPEEWQPGVRVFAGYAGWSPGQLEDEIAGNSWLVLPPSRELVEMSKPEDAWDQIIARSSPLLRLLAAAPDDPSLN